MDLETVHRRLEAEGAADNVRVAIDAMGGDHAPEEVVRGALDWARDGRNPRVTAALQQAGAR